MPQLGTSTKPTNSVYGSDGTGFANQYAEILTTAEKIKITRLGSWIGGWNDTVHFVMCIWNMSNVLIASTAEQIAADEGNAAPSSQSNYEADLTTPLTLNAGDEFYVGLSTNRDDAKQIGMGGTGNDHYRARGAYPSSNIGAIEAPATFARRIGMYVADYQLVSAGWVRRSGVWVQATSIQVRRSGAWVDIDSVQVRRSSAWADAS